MHVCDSVTGHQDTAASQWPEENASLIDVTHDLGIQYLWVDALCIIQDSMDNIQSEINNMESIYKGATLTIASRNSDTANGGFLAYTPKIRAGVSSYLSVCLMETRRQSNL
jgi:hypothetical protein